MFYNIILYFMCFFVYSNGSWTETPHKDASPSCSLKHLAREDSPKLYFPQIGAITISSKRVLLFLACVNVAARSVDALALFTAQDLL